jgi:O-antigen ligase
MPALRPITAVERGCLAILLLWLAWLPLPFGSVVAAAHLPLIAVPFSLCAIMAIARLFALRDRKSMSQPTRAWLIWASGALSLTLVYALQLVPLPPSVLRALSPESETIWQAAMRVASLGGVAASTAHPISVAPSATAFELFRLAALLAAFACAGMLIRTHTRRVIMVVVLCCTAIFESLYGLREAALQRYEIWGWVNRLIFDRVTGTFVNPNHFAHYLGLVLPMALFLAAFAWHISGPREMPAPRRLAHLLERHVLSAGFALLATIACAAAMLLAQSRGALLALASGLLFVAALLPGRRVARIGLAAACGVALFVTMIIYLGPERTVRRFVPNQVERETFVGRRVGIAAAVALWQRFSVFGSGAGTFERVVSMEQDQDLDKIYHHAHNDYAELAATAGTLGLMIAVVSLIGGYAALVRMTVGAQSTELTWRRRAFQTAALASLTMAMVHALFDFNFYIPSNPATLVVILGAAVASVDHDKRARR